ncbi:hypothetical protein AVEN_228365-1 [Araneus ventricosus]|uniref:Uncharacterized protein n=1 Tax=Araneus ventricosus TaxID=182803 RepID=A0A4Y2K659_ARAVE|nr:hypothetical protein AVEN_228365-1 [Araneus ventricosus]
MSVAAALSCSCFMEANYPTCWLCGGPIRKGVVIDPWCINRLGIPAAGWYCQGDHTPTPGNSYVSVAKKSFSAPSFQKNPDVCAIPSSKPSDSTAKAYTSITSLQIPSSPSVAPVSEEALASPDFTDFKLVTNQKRLKKNSPTKTNNTITKAEKIAKFYTTSHREITNPIPTKDNISSHQYALKPFATTKPTSVDTELLPMVVLPPLEKILLQSRESDADAKMSSSSLSEEDAIEYNMSEDLEDSPAIISRPPSFKPRKANNYKNK